MHDCSFTSDLLCEKIRNETTELFSQWKPPAKRWTYVDTDVTYAVTLDTLSVK